MAKPILVISFPYSYQEDDTDYWRNMQKQTKELLNDEYHVLFLSVDEDVCEVARVEVFYEKDFNIVKYEELKQIILNKINGK